jgi:hypothetical protein
MGGPRSFTFHSLTSQCRVHGALYSSLEIAHECNDLHNIPYNSIHMKLEQMCHFSLRYTHVQIRM